MASRTRRVLGFCAGLCGLALAALMFFWSASGSISVASSGPLTVPVSERTDRVIIKFRASHEDQRARLDGARLGALSALAGMELAPLRAMSGGAQVLRLPHALDLAQVEALVGRLAGAPEVEYAEVDRRVWPLLVPNDGRYFEQWHYFEDTGGVRLPQAWDVTTGASAIVVAVLDTGILADHPDLQGRTLAGYDFISNFGGRPNDGDGRDPDASDPGNWVAPGECENGSPVMDSNWHGTHVAGTIGAASDNGQGVVGINWVSQILPVRVLGKCGGFTSDLVDGMRWSVGMAVPGVPANPTPARVLNLSLASRGVCAAILQSAVDDVVASGAVVVAGVGNAGADAGN